MAPSFGTMIRQAREVRGLSAVDAARSAGISAAYLSKLENDGVKKPSPHVLHQLSEALAVPVRGAHAPERLPAARCEPDRPAGAALGAAALFADRHRRGTGRALEYLAWFRARRRSGRIPDRGR